MTLMKSVNGVVRPLNEKEIAEYEARQELAKKENEELKKTEYLRQRKFDPDMPTLEEKVDAIYESLAMKDNSKLNKIKVKIENVKRKHPKPQESKNEEI